MRGDCSRSSRWVGFSEGDSLEVPFVVVVSVSWCGSGRFEIADVGAGAVLGEVRMIWRKARGWEESMVVAA